MKKAVCQEHLYWYQGRKGAVRGSPPEVTAELRFEERLGVNLRRLFRENIRGLCERMDMESKGKGDIKNNLLVCH